MKFTSVNGISVEELEDGLLVSQYNQAYLARRWRLTKNTIDLIEAATSAGLRWMIRDGHPQAHSLWPKGRGRVYLAFSPTREQQWSLAVDRLTADKSDFGIAVFNGKYHQQFLDADFPFRFEKRNTTSGHLEISRDHVFDAIALLKNFDHSVLYLSRKPSDSIGFTTEYDIQRSLILNWNRTALAKTFAIYGDEIPLTSGLNSRRIDILALSRDKQSWLVIELKRASATLDAVDQLSGYVTDIGLNPEFSGLPVYGMLIAERLPPLVRAKLKALGLAGGEISFPHNIISMES